MTSLTPVIGQSHCFWYMGYWPSLRSRRLDIGQVPILFSVHKHEKKERGQYPAILTEQAWSIKDLLYEIKQQNMINFPCETKLISRAGKIAPLPMEANTPKKSLKRGPKFKETERTTSDVCRLCLINLKQKIGDLSKYSYIYYGGKCFFSRGLAEDVKMLHVMLH